MRIICLSDTHERHHKVQVPDGDVLVHAGDITIAGDKYAYQDFYIWFEALPHKHKILVPGNHDALFDQVWFSQICNVLISREITIEGKRFYGCPFTPAYGWTKAFMIARNSPELFAEYSKIPEDLDVLVTHGPPQGILDTVLPDSEHLGDRDLAIIVDVVKPRIHAFGHIHPAYGRRQFGETLFINCSVTNAAYQPVNPVQVVDL